MWDYNLFGLKWGSKKTTVRNIGKDTKKLNNGHFLRNQINARREEKRISPEEKERDKERNGSPAICFSCPPLGSKMEFENTTWPNGIRCVNESTLSLSLRVSAPTYLIVGRRMYWRNCSVVRHVSWWSGLPWIQAVLKSPAHVCESTKSTLNFLFYYKK